MKNKKKTWLGELKDIVLESANTVYDVLLVIATLGFIVSLLAAISQMFFK